MLLQGKKVIITGGLTGIGRETCHVMLEEGASVVSFSRAAPDSERAQRLYKETEQFGADRFKHIQCDVTDKEQAFSAVNEAVKFMGGLDSVVHCAAVQQFVPAEDLTPKDLYDMFGVSVVGMAMVCAAAFPHLKEKGGTILTYSSYAGMEGVPGMPAYSAAKGAVLAYSRVIARDWAQYNIRTNIINPAVMTELAHEWKANMDPEERAANAAWLKHTVPLGGDLGDDPRQVAYLNAFLASDKAIFIHGQTIGVNGGMVFTR